MTTYKFNDSKGNEYTLEFASVDDARRYSYVHGLCFLGRV